jgi:hypothetical protein
VRKFPLLVGLLLAVAIHADWHLARSHGHRLSGAWAQHWLVGMPVFAFIALYVARTGPLDTWRASARLIGAGIFLGMVLEPLAEALLYNQPLSALEWPARWTAFSEFGAAGLLTYLWVMALAERDRAAN